MDSKLTEWQVTGILLRQNAAPESHLISQSGNASLIFIYFLSVLMHVPSVSTLQSYKKPF